MAKGKAPSGVQNRHIYNRASYMYQAATYLASQQSRPSPNTATNTTNTTTTTTPTRGDGSYSAPTPSKAQYETLQNMSRLLLTGMRAVTLKAQVRQSPALKRTVCKFCDALLIEGQTCTSVVENASKGGRKPWADVLTTKCHSCGNSRRYPVGAKRQQRRSLRPPREQRPEGRSEGQLARQADEGRASAS